MGVIPPLSHAEWVESFERYQQFPEYRQLRPQMTLAEYQGIFFWEYLHRLLARLIGTLFLVPFAFFYFSGALTRRMTLRFLALFALGSMQGVVGWLMVKSGLVDRPSVSHYRLAVHLTLALAVIGTCVWMTLDVVPAVRRASIAPAARARVTRILSAVGVLLGAQIVWGAFVAGLKAGAVFPTFPLMAGTLVPVSSWTLQPVVLNLVQGAAGVHWMHRLLGTALLVAACAQYAVVRRATADRTSRRLSVALLSAVALQYTLGVLTVLYVVPVSLAATHQATAVAIVVLWIGLMHEVRSQRVTSVRRAGS